MSEQKIETPAAELAEVSKPKLADGLFKPYTLGSTLSQGATGNVMTNVRPNMMDYEKQYQSSTKNESLSAEELEKIGQKPAEVKKSLNDFEFASVPVEQREMILTEMDRRIEEAKKSNDAETIDRIEKAKDKAKKCWGPQMGYKQPKASDSK